MADELNPHPYAEREALHVTPGRIVNYETDRRGGLSYYLPAMVVVTEVNQAGPHPEPSEYADLATVEPGCVHLVVFTPGPGSTYTELNVPFDDRIDPDTGRHYPRTWSWPTRT